MFIPNLETAELSASAQTGSALYSLFETCSFPSTFHGHVIISNPMAHKTQGKSRYKVTDTFYHLINILHQSFINSINI